MDYLLENEDKIAFGKKKIAKKAVELHETIGCEIIEKESGGKKIFYAMLNKEAIALDLGRYLEAYFETDLGYEPLMIEEKMTVITTDFETKLDHPIPIKGRFDLITKDADGKVVLVDHKLMGQKPKTDDDGEYIIEPGWIMQAACYESMLDQKIDYCSFDVMVKGANPSFHQVKFELTDLDRLAWSRLYKSTIYKLLLSASIEDVDLCFSPNPWHQFQKDGWTEYMIDMEYLLENEEHRAVEVGDEDEEYEALDL